MANEDDNTELINQASNALEFLNQFKEQVQEKIDLIKVDISYLEENISEINNCLSSGSNSKDSNTVLFSPTVNKEKVNKYNCKQQENMMNYEDELINSRSKLLLLNNRRISLSNTISCLDKLNNIRAQKQEGIEKSYKKNGEHEIENSGAQGINLLETQENERKRIARDLHDSTVQNLTSMMHKTELCTRLIDIDSVRAKLELQTMIHTIKATINDMRNIIYDLRPMSLDDLGLVVTIDRFIKEIKSNHVIDLSLSVINKEKIVLPIINLTLFRIIQEASNNSLKHAKATKIIIGLEYNDDSILLSISDNGLGFKQLKSNESENNILSGFGLSIMKERVLLLSGEIKIESDTNIGTKITVKVPLRTYKEDK